MKINNDVHLTKVGTPVHDSLLCIFHLKDISSSSPASIHVVVLIVVVVVIVVVVIVIIVVVVIVVDVDYSDNNGGKGFDES